MTLHMKDICDLLKQDEIQWSGHILIKMQQRGIKIKDVLACVNSGEIIELYPKDYPYPSCLILGYTPDDIGIHVVCAVGENKLWMITAYLPDEKEWFNDFRTRRR